MRLIVTHEQPDFDALASLALARLLFPGSVATTQGALNRQLKAFIHLYRDQLDLTPHDQIDLGQVTELVVVDTADPARIKPFDQLLGKVPVTLYDHHPTPANAIVAARGMVEQLGATATLLTREIIGTSITIPPPVATLALLAIHEDTGNLTFDLTTPADYQAAAHLLASGANLGVVRRFAHDQLDPDQIEFREALLKHATTTEVAGRPVVTAAFEHPKYVSAVSGLVNDLLGLYAVDAAIVAVRMDDSTLVFARSNKRFNCAAALAETIGGGGHSGAAFGKTDDPPDSALKQVLSALQTHAAPTVTARQLMSSPVKAARHSDTVAQAVQRLLLYGHNGMPVLNDSGQVTGVVSRRDLDRAIRHGMGESRVTGFMSKDVISASPETTLTQLEELVLRHNIGRIPILDQGNLVGIVTRTDLIGARHNRPTYPKAEKLLSRLTPNARQALDHARQLSEGVALYLVGGTVRDLLIGAGVKDLDLVITGDAARFGTKLQAALGGTLSAHVEFGTATLELPSGLELDIAAAREETYAHPGALPDVVPSSIGKDLARRDFTVNAMALRLNPVPTELLDPYSGQADLKARHLRVLHPLSFLEDPTRVLRGSRLAGRLGFTFAPSTADLAKTALESGQLATVSHSRSRAELQLMFDEPRVLPALNVLSELGALQSLFYLGTKDGPYDGLSLVQTLDDLRRDNNVPTESYLLALLLGVNTETAERHIEDFNWPRRLLQTRQRLLTILGHEPRTNGHAGGVIRDEDLEALDAPARWTLRAAQPDLAGRLERLEVQPTPRRLRGSDVVALGLPPGPAIGQVLDQVAQARAEGRASTFEQELELARNLVGDAGRPEDPE